MNNGSPVRPMKEQPTAGELSVAAGREQLETVQSFVEERIQGRFSAWATRQVLLVVEEVFINIARYAYPRGAGRVSVSCVVGQDRVRLVFADEGIPYNPLEQQAPDLTLGAEERPVGGLGIYLIRELMDEVSYRYECGRNILSLERYVDHSG